MFFEHQDPVAAPAAGDDIEAIHDVGQERDAKPSGSQLVKLLGSMTLIWFEKLIPAGADRVVDCQDDGDEVLTNDGEEEYLSVRAWPAMLQAVRQCLTGGDDDAIKQLIGDHFTG